MWQRQQVSFQDAYGVHETKSSPNILGLRKEYLGAMNNFHNTFWSFEDRSENGYPARSHDCKPEETEFANAFEDAQLDLERREKNAKKKRSMAMWHNVIEKTWNSRPIEEVQKLIDRQPMVMRAIIEADGGQTPY